MKLLIIPINNNFLAAWAAHRPVWSQTDKQTLTPIFSNAYNFYEDNVCVDNVYADDDYVDRMYVANVYVDNVYVDN